MSWKQRHAMRMFFRSSLWPIPLACMVAAVAVAHLILCIDRQTGWTLNISADAARTVGATLAGRPSVGIGYSPKVDALARDLGAASRVVPWSRHGIASIADAVRDVAPHGDDALEGRELLRARERGSDDAIDELLSHLP